MYIKLSIDQTPSSPVKTTFTCFYNQTSEKQKFKFSQHEDVHAVNALLLKEIIKKKLPHKLLWAQNIVYPQSQTHKPPQACILVLALPAKQIQKARHPQWGLQTVHGILTVPYHFAAKSLFESENNTKPLCSSGFVKESSVHWRTWELFSLVLNNWTVNQVRLWFKFYLVSFSTNTNLAKVNLYVDVSTLVQLKSFSFSTQSPVKPPQNTTGNNT